MNNQSNSVCSDPNLDLAHEVIGDPDLGKGKFDPFQNQYPNPFPYPDPTSVVD